MKKRSRKQLKSKRKIKRYGNTIKLSPKKIYELVTLLGCPYCEGAKELIKEKGHSFKVIEEMDFSDSKNKNKWNKFVKKEYKRNDTTFPKIFLGDKFIGGFDNLKNLI